jgi:hypothetical protein
MWVRSPPLSPRSLHFYFSVEITFGNFRKTSGNFRKPPENLRKIPKMAENYGNANVFLRPTNRKHFPLPGQFGLAASDYLYGNQRSEFYQCWDENIYCVCFAKGSYELAKNIVLAIKLMHFCTNMSFTMMRFSRMWMSFTVVRLNCQWNVATSWGIWRAAYEAVLKTVH